MLNFDPARVKRVLIYRLGSLGDTVVALPALHLVERAFPHARRLMLTNIPVHAKAPAASAVLEGSGLVHGYLSYPVGTRSLRKLSALWWRIRRFRPHVLIYLMPARGRGSLNRDTWFFRLCGSPQIIGLPAGDRAEPALDPNTRVWEHEASRLLRCLRSLGDADLHDPAAWDLRLTPEENRTATDVLACFAGQPFIACGPGTKMQAKDWGQQNWRALLARLAVELPGRGLVLVGAKEDAPVSDYASAQWTGPVANLCGLLTPRETAAVLRRSELFLGPDSGPMHLAAAYGVPCAIVYASRSRRGHWFPVGNGHQVVYHTLPCSLCNLEICIENKRECITSISIAEMTSAAMKAWQFGQDRLAANSTL